MYGASQKGQVMNEPAASQPVVLPSNIPARLHELACQENCAWHTWAQQRAEAKKRAMAGVA